MSVPARRGRLGVNATEPFNIDFEDVRTVDVLAAGERICPPPERGSTSGAALFLLALLLVGAGALYAGGDWVAWLGDRAAALRALPSGGPTTVVTSEVSSVTLATSETNDATGPVVHEAPSPPIVEAQIAGQTGQEPVAQVETASIPDDAEALSPADASAPPQPLPPPQVNQADPYQRRASAAGLHPGLSRVLLARMSANDYRNARYAVDTAMAKTGDEDEFIWPRQRRPEQALFRIHFVPGAPPQCRRYVVTVVKEGWTTTAAPLERCGAVPKNGSKAAR
ncbi:MAG: hypothetical protein WC829_16160 [Hyphomicrobium sp.]|jgi:hypothetical protein